MLRNLEYGLQKFRHNEKRSMNLKFLVTGMLAFVLVAEAGAAQTRQRSTTTTSKSKPKPKPAPRRKPKPKPKPAPVETAPKIEPEPVIDFEPPKPKIVEPDLTKLRNDKEAVISVFGQRDQDDINKRYGNQEFNQRITEILFATLRDFLRENKNRCDLDLVSRFEKRLESEGLPHTESALSDYLKLLRVQDSIDDVFYDILSASLKDYQGLRTLDTSRAPKRVSARAHKLEETNPIKELYSNFDTFPDDTDLCAFQEFIYLKNNFLDEKGNKPKNPLKILGDLNRKALELNVINLDSYHRLEFLRTKSQLEHRYVFLRDYLKIIFFAKNQMVPRNHVYKPIKIEDEDRFSSERVKRFSRLTRRKILYRKYNETQIILLAQVMQKASRRMGTDVDTESGVPYIIQEFKVLEEDGQQRTYVERLELDPQSQFNFARRLLRKDILDLQMMDTFNQLTITYQDVVMAAFETGYITIEDINYVVRYDDLWNPATSKFERIMGFVFKVSGYGTFFLPPPWNVVGTLALGIVEGLVEQKLSTGADNDNPATFIE